MKKWLSPLLFASCLIGAGIGAAEAKQNCNCNCDKRVNITGKTNMAENTLITNVDAITTAPLHVRNGPGRHYKSRDILPPDFPLVVGSCTRDWCQVYYNSARSGWSSLPYLAFKKGGKHYKDRNLGPFGNEVMAMRGPRRAVSRGRHRIAYSVNGGAYAINGRQAGDRRMSGWWTNYQRPTYHRAWQPRWWQKK